VRDVSPVTQVLYHLKAVLIGGCVEHHLDPCALFYGAHHLFILELIEIVMGQHQTQTALSLVGKNRIDLRSGEAPSLVYI
jgi:hypothetical protein